MLCQSQSVLLWNIFFHPLAWKRKGCHVHTVLIIYIFSNRGHFIMSSSIIKLFSALLPKPCRYYIFDQLCADVFQSCSIELRQSVTFLKPRYRIIIRCWHHLYKHVCQPQFSQVCTEPNLQGTMSLYRFFLMFSCFSAVLVEKTFSMRYFVDWFFSLWNTKDFFTTYIFN